MKAALLALITTGALLVSTSSAEAGPPRAAPVFVYPNSYSAPYLGGYVYPAGGVGLSLGNNGLGFGNSFASPYTYSYPYWSYNRGYSAQPYSRPYYGNDWHYQDYRGWRW